MTTTTATSSNATSARSQNPNSNYDGATMYVQNYPGSIIRVFAGFTLPSDPGGTITKIELYLRTVNGNTAEATDVHEITTSGFDDAQATWNSYSTGNSWTTPGGDYSGTIIDTITPSTVANTWNVWTIQGTGATNPLSLDWGDSIDLLLKFNDESANGHYVGFYGDHTAGSEPYLLITYTEGSSVVLPQFVGFAGL